MASNLLYGSLLTRVNAADEKTFAHHVATYGPQLIFGYKD
jgi:hypothetical protein